MVVNVVRWISFVMLFVGGLMIFPSIFIWDRLTMDIEYVNIEFSSCLVFLLVEKLNQRFLSLLECDTFGTLNLVFEPTPIYL